MIGVWANALTVAVGGLIGTFLRGGISEKFRATVNHALGLCVLVIGISGAIATKDMMGVIVSVVVGAGLGEAAGIEPALDRLGDWAQARFARGDSSFSQGFVSATLLFCVGAMAVVGSLEAGLKNQPDTLLAKAALDGVAAVILASTMGPGVILSLVPLTIYQGGIALLATHVAPLLSPVLIGELSAVGSVMIVALSLNMLGLMKPRIKVANLLPGMLVVLLYAPVAGWIAARFM